MEKPTFQFALREDIKDEKQFLPSRAEPKATGWDVRAAFPDRKSVVLRPFQKFAIPLGFKAFCPDGWWYELKPRSSTYAKKHLNCLYGTIDETYEGELIFACQYIPPMHDFTGLFTTEHFMNWFLRNSIQIDFGDAIGQIIPRLRQEMEVMEISNEQYKTNTDQRNSVRRDGGFGSTDAKK